MDIVADLKTGTKEQVKRRQLQAKMAVELINTDKTHGEEILRDWKEMSEVWIQIGNMSFKTLDDYLATRYVDVGTP